MSWTPEHEKHLLCVKNSYVKDFKKFHNLKVLEIKNISDQMRSTSLYTTSALLLNMSSQGMICTNIWRGHFEIKDTNQGNRHP